MTTIAEFASFLVGLRGRPAFRSVREAACLRLFDALGSAAVGFHTDEGRAMARLLAASPDGGGHLSPSDLLRQLTVAIRCTEIDDINIDSCTTVGSVVIPVALAAASARTAPAGHDLLAGIVAGYEAMVRMGDAIEGATILYKGIWPTYVTAPFAAAAATAAVWNMSVEETAHALSLALARTSVVATVASGGVSPRSWLLAMAAREGYDAARAAAHGFAGSGREFAAFSARYDITLDEAVMLRSPDRTPVILRVDTKPYPTARQALSAIEAFRSLLPLPYPFGDMVRIEVRVPGQLREMITRSPNGRIDSMVSLPYQMALAATAPQKLYDVVRTNLPMDAGTSDFMEKVVIEADPELTSLFPAIWGARLAIRWASGQESISEILHPAGSALHPLDWNGMADKLTAILTASGVGSPDALAGLEQACRDVDTADGIDVATQLLRPLAEVAEFRFLAPPALARDGK